MTSDIQASAGAERELSPDHLACIALMRRGRPRARVIRPATVGDGVLRLGPTEVERWEHLGRTSAARGVGFVPASGAATRLFEALALAAAAGVVDPSALRRLPWGAPAAAALEGRRDLACWPVGPDPAAELAALLASPWPGLPKGVLPFHRYPSGEVRAAWQEHLVEARALGLAGLHLTVSSSQLGAWASAAAAGVDLSQQRPDTDTPALELDGRLALDEEGQPLFRPGGHGALLPNLEALRADLVLVKNVDNVVVDAARGLVLRWRRVLLGVLLDVEARLNRVAAAFGRGQLLAAHQEAEPVWGACPPGVDLAGWLADQLARPLRVAGVVPVSGQPGGGPFWVADPAGRPRLQIVEQVEFDPSCAEHAQILAASTHFNPVDLVLRPRGFWGTPRPLADFADPDAALITTKVVGGRPVRVLERPGLWNGAMAGWTTVFVEVPPEVFHPVKTLADLLAPAHRGDDHDQSLASK